LRRLDSYQKSGSGILFGRIWNENIKCSHLYEEIKEKSAGEEDFTSPLYVAGYESNEYLFLKFNVLNFRFGGF